MRDETKQRVARVLQEQLALPEAPDELNRLNEDLGAMSLDLASIQLALEDAFGIKFADGPKSFTEIDREWETVKTVGDVVTLVENWRYFEGDKK